MDDEVQKMTDAELEKLYGEGAPTVYVKGGAKPYDFFGPTRFGESGSVIEALKEKFGASVAKVLKL
jgi:hypothetical protein